VVEPVTHQERRETTQAIKKADCQCKEEEARKEKQEKEAAEKVTKAKDSERMDQDASEAPHVSASNCQPPAIEKMLHLSANLLKK
ncbi:hypothetical protein L0F63_002487, partial [Massospora cicadina]